MSFHGRRSLDGQSFTGSFVHCLVFLFPVHAATFDMSRKKPSNGRCLRAGLAILWYGRCQNDYLTVFSQKKKYLYNTEPERITSGCYRVLPGFSFDRDRFDRFFFFWSCGRRWPKSKIEENGLSSATADALSNGGVTTSTITLPFFLKKKKKFTQHRAWTDY